MNEIPEEVLDICMACGINIDNFLKDYEVQKYISKEIKLLKTIEQALKYE